MQRMQRLQGVSIEPVPAKPEPTVADEPSEPSVGVTDRVSVVPLPSPRLSSIGIGTAPAHDSGRDSSFPPQSCGPRVPFDVASTSPAASASFVAMHSDLHAGIQTGLLGRTGLSPFGVGRPPAFGSAHESMLPSMSQPMLSPAQRVQPSQCSPPPPSAQPAFRPSSSPHVTSQMPHPSVPLQPNHSESYTLPPVPLPHMGAHRSPAAPSPLNQPRSPFLPPQNGPFSTYSPSASDPRSSMSGRKPVRIRTPAAVIDAVGGLTGEMLKNVKADGFPIGPIAGLGQGEKSVSEELLNELKRYSVNPNLGGGGFGITRDGGGSRVGVGTPTHGPHYRISCNQKSKFGCTWSITYEETTEGLMPVKYQKEHVRVQPGSGSNPVLIPSHALENSQSGVATSRSGRHIPAELHDTGRLLSSVCSTMQVHEGLQKEAKRLGIDHNTWGLSDVRREFPSDLGNGTDFDATGLVEHLEKRNNEHGLRYVATHDMTSHLNKVMVELAGARSEWATCISADGKSSSNVLLFDPTHSTNRYGLKLCFFTSVGANGQTVVLAFCVIKHESIADIQWAFRMFHNIFRAAPSVLMTDGDAAIAGAFDECSQSGDIWEHVPHLLCVYHLSKNVFQKVHPLFSHDPAKWRDAFSLFWRIAKLNDEKFAQWHGSDDGDTDIVTFESLWLSFLQFVDTHGQGTTKQDVLVWLDRSLYCRKEMWVACYTWAHMTWGCHSTQRAESANAQLKRRRALANYSLLRLVENIEDMNDDVRYRKEVDAVRQRLKHLSSAAIQSPELTELGKKVTPYGMELIRAQMSRILLYSFEETDEIDSNDSAVYLVTYKTVLDKTPEVEMESSGHVSSFADDRDFGLGHFELVTHRCSLDRCSCQLLSSHGIVCAHILLVRHHFESQPGRMRPCQDLYNLIGVKWHMAGDAVMGQRLSTLQSFPSASTRPARSATIPREDRYSHLMEELRGLADVAARDMSTYQSLLEQLPGIAKTLQPSTGEHGSRSASHAGASGVSSQAAGTSSTACGTGSKTARKTVDYADFIDNVQHHDRFSIDSCIPTAAQLRPMSDEGKVFVNRYIAYKWEHKAAKGWIYGRILSQRSDESPHPDETNSDSDDEGDNFFVEWSDGWNISIMLVPFTYVNSTEVKKNCSQNSWTLLVERCGDDVASAAASGELRDPVRPPKKGRKSHLRLASVAGPMAKRRK